MPRNASAFNLAAKLRRTFTGEPHERALIEVRRLPSADVFHVDHLSPRLLRRDAAIEDCELLQAKFLKGRLIPPAHSHEQELLEAAALHLLDDLNDFDQVNNTSNIVQFPSITLRSVSPRADECIIDLRDGFHAGLIRDLVAVGSARSAWGGGIPGLRFARHKGDVVVALLNAGGVPAGKLRVRKVPSRHWTMFHDYIDHLVDQGALPTSPIISESSAMIAFNKKSSISITAAESSAILAYQRHQGGLAGLGSLMFRRVGLIAPVPSAEGSHQAKPLARSAPLSPVFRQPTSVAYDLLHPVAGFIHFCEDFPLLHQPGLLEIVSSRDITRNGATGTPRIILSDSNYPKVTRQPQPGRPAPIRFWSAETVRRFRVSASLPSPEPSEHQH